VLHSARLAVAVALVVLAPLDAAARWTQLQSAHFLFIGDAAERDIRATAQKLEQFREVMVRALPAGAAMTSPVPTVVFVFANDRSLAPYRPKFEGRPIEMAGLFVQQSDINYVAVNADAYQQAFNVVLHEYSHFLLGNWLESVPVWMNEGLAEVYATFQERDGGKGAVLGAPDGNHLGLLRRSTLIPIRDLLAIDHSSPTYNEGSRRGVLYAESWALVHYLAFGNRARTPQLAAFLKAVKGGAPPVPAFTEAFGSVAKLEQELREYIHSFTMPAIRIDFGEKISGAIAPRGEAMPDAHAAAYLGDFLARVGRTDEARTQLRALLEQNPDVARAACALGLLELRGDRRAEGVTLLERAAALAPGDAWIQTALGQALLTASEEPLAEGEADALLQRARAALAQAASGDAAAVFAQTLASLGRAHTMPGGDLPRAVSSLERAVTLTPGREDYRLMLAYALIRQGEDKRAIDQLGPLVARSGRADVRDNARRLLGSIASRANAVGHAASPTETRTEALSDPPTATTAVSSTTSSRAIEVAGSTPAAPAREAVFRPILRPVGAGETRVRGVFRSVDCRPEGLVFVIDRDGAMLRLAAATFDEVEFLSYRRNTPNGVRCGAQQPALPVLATFRSMAAPGGAVGGQLVAIEVVEDDFVPR
jgi:tetratricopeptide (TPR) repeat protein